MKPKQLPALMDGGTMILPPATLSPPSKRDGGRGWWEKTARAILIPRWAAECIGAGIVYGQELREGESMRERVESIMGNPAEMDKWETLAGWGPWVRDMPPEKWERWGGGVHELQKLGGNIELFHGVLDWTTGRKLKGYAVAVRYWAYWMERAWRLAKEASAGGLDAEGRERAGRLLAEGRAYWGKPVLTCGECYSGREGKWIPMDSGYQGAAVECVAALLAPTVKRKGGIVGILATLAECLFFAKHLAGELREQVDADAWLSQKLADAEARVADAERRAAAEDAAKAGGERDLLERLREDLRAYHAEIMQGIGTATAAAEGAERASLRAEATVKGKAEVGALAADLVETFKAFDGALKDEEGTQLEIAAGVIADAKEKGRLIGNGQTGLFLRYWRGWVKRGRPDAEQYRVIYEREGRWPE